MNKKPILHMTTTIRSKRWMVFYEAWGVEAFVANVTVKIDPSEPRGNGRMVSIDE